MKKKIFISGKITGERIWGCYMKFLTAKNKIAYIDMTTAFENIIIPLSIEGIHFGISHEDAMRICFDALKDCTHIYMLKDWKDSEGAKMEYEFAKESGIEIIYEI